MKRVFFLAALLAAQLIFIVPAFAQTERSISYCSLTADSAGKLQVRIRYARIDAENDYTWNTSRTIDADQAGPKEFTIAPDRRSFEMVRDAGTLHCNAGTEQGTSGGTLTFVPNPKFIAEIQRRGMRPPTSDELFQLVLSGISLAYIDAVRAVVKAPVTFENVMQLLNHGVSASMLQEFKSAGYRADSVSEIARLRDHGVDAKYLAAFRAAGLANVSTSDLVTARDHGVSADFAAGMYKLGITSMKDITRMRDVGLTVSYVHDVRAAGYKTANLDELQRLRDHAVSGAYLASLANLGLHFSIDDLVRLRDHGVTPDYVQRLRDHGFKNLSVDDIIRLREHGV